jgi:hypothetical protein
LIPHYDEYLTTTLGTAQPDNDTGVFSSIWREPLGAECAHKESNLSPMTRMMMKVFDFFNATSSLY